MYALLNIEMALERHGLGSFKSIHFCYNVGYIFIFFFHNRECSFMRRVYFFSQTKEPVMYHTDEVPFDPNEIQPNDSEVVCLIKELIET